MKDNQKMVGATGIEPVTPTMSTNERTGLPEHENRDDSMPGIPVEPGSTPNIADVSGAYLGRTIPTGLPRVSQGGWAA